MKTGKEEGPGQTDTKAQNVKPASAEPSQSDSEGSRMPAMAGLVVAVVLLVIGLWLARELTSASKMQDCVMSGRTNCNVIRPQ